MNNGEDRTNGPITDHFDGERFYNERPIKHSFKDFRCWVRTREHNPWERITGFVPPAPPPQRVDDLRVSWIGHATVLIQTAGLNILTDPIFSDRIGPIPGFGPRRYHPPGVAFDDLPPIDAVLISHAHYDHLDRPTLRRLVARFDPLIVAGLGLRRLLKTTGTRRVVTADWWQDVTLSDTVQTTLTPARHWSRRGLFDRNRSLWAGFWLHTPAGAVYFAGDTGMAPHFDAIRQQLGRPRVALLPIGAYEPRWFMAQQHMNPEEAVTAHQILGAEHSIGIHFATFKLSDEAKLAPVTALDDARKAASVTPQAFLAPAFGHGYTFD